MTPEQEKSWIKANRDQLKEFFSKRIGILFRLMLEAESSQRDKYIDSINILRDWLRESEIIGKDELPKPTTFI